MATMRGLWEGVPIQFFTEGSSYGDTKISPDGKLLSVIINGCVHVADVKRDGSSSFDIDVGSLVQLTTLKVGTGTEYGGAVYCWSGDSKNIFFTSEGKLHRISVEGGLPQELGTISGTLCYAPSHSSLTDKLVSCAETSTKIGIAVYNNADGHSGDVWPSSVSIPYTFAYDPLLHPHNNDILIFTAWSIPNMIWNESYLVLMNLKENSLKPVYKKDNVSVLSPQFSPDGKYISFASDETGYFNLHLCDSDGNNIQNIVDEKFDLGFPHVWTTDIRPYVWLDNNRIVYTHYGNNGAIDVFVVDIHTKKSTHLSALPRGLYTNLHSAHDGRHIVCGYTNYCTAATIVVIDVEKATMKPLFRSKLRLPPSLQSKLVDGQHFDFPVKEGVTSHGILYFPKDPSGTETPAPLILTVHGGPTGVSKVMFDPYVSYFVAKGWAVCAINYRGSIGYGRAHRDALMKQWGVADTEDVIAAAKYFQSQSNIDGDRIVVMGGSAGGFLTYNSLIHGPGLFAAGVVFCGVADLYGLDKNTHLLEKHYDHTLIGPLAESRAAYHDRSPCNFANKIIDPILILQGETDTVVPKAQSDFMAKNVRGPVEYHKFPENHMFAFYPPNVKKLLPIIDSFLELHVLMKRS